MNIDELTLGQLKEIKKAVGVSSSKTKEIDGGVRIVILQRGWVMVGKYRRKGKYCYLDNASVIRIWGTTKGIGEIASCGPTSLTKLDKCFGEVEFHELTVIATLKCEVEKWEKYL
jgi:hypothetical protein